MFAHGTVHIRRLAREANRFVIGQSRAGRMFDEFCHSGLVDDEDVARSGVREAYIFEFDWGFLAESFKKGEGWRWSFYVQHVWRTGTAEWWDEFANAHQRLIQSHMALIQRMPQCSVSGLPFERGEQCFSALTYRCNCESALCARTWIGWTLLPTLWPRVLRTTMDPVFESSAFSHLS